MGRRFIFKPSKMTKLIFEALAWGLASGIVGATYRGILAEEPSFNKWWRFGARFERRWFFKPLWGCGHCAAGQFALWTFVALRILPAIVTHCRRFSAFAEFPTVRTFQVLAFLFALFVAITTAILVAKVLQLLLNRLQ